MTSQLPFCFWEEKDDSIWQREQHGEKELSSLLPNTHSGFVHFMRKEDFFLANNRLINIQRDIGNGKRVTLAQLTQHNQ